jgi:hypothetical protein
MGPNPLCAVASVAQYSGSCRAVLPINSKEQSPCRSLFAPDIDLFAHCSIHKRPATVQGMTRGLNADISEKVLYHLAPVDLGCIKGKRMFARKGKPRDDEDPVVPHGFLWQATDEPARAPAPSSEQPKGCAPLAELSPSADEALIPTTNESKGGRKLSAISPATAWRSLKIQAIRHLSTRKATVTSEADEQVHAPSEATFSPAHEALDRTTKTGSASPVFIQCIHGLRFCTRRLQTKSAHVLRALSARLTGSLRGLPAVIARALLLLRINSAKTTARLRPWYEAFDFQGQLRVSRTYATQCAKNVSTHIGAILRVASRCSAQWSERSGRLVQAVTAQGRGLVQHISLQTGQDLRRAWSNRTSVRRRIPETIRLQTRLGKIRKWDILARQVAKRHLTTMSMAALSAVLAMTFISLVKHYAPANQASAGKPTQEPVLLAPVQAAAFAQPKPAMAKKNDSENSQVPQLQKSKPAPSPTPKNNTAQRKMRDNADDDYVAGDTYVHYGSPGKPQGKSATFATH